MISNKTIIAIEVCVFLANNAKQRNVTTDAMSSQLGISVSYLEYILKTLKLNGIVAAAKGPGGGYHIQASSSDISIWEVAKVFETTLHSVSIEQTQTSNAPSAYELGLQAVIRDQLESSKLTDFIDLEPRDSLQAEETLCRFRLKPLITPVPPKAANSVFQWHTVI